MMNIKIKAILGISFFILLSVVKAEVVLNRIVAVVNSDIIAQSDLDKKISQLQLQKVGGNKIGLRKRALDDLIDISLQLQLAKRGGLNVSDSELDQVVANIAKSNGLTVDQLKISLSERDGISYDEFRKKLRRQGLITKVQQQFLGRKIVINKADIDHILRNPPKTNIVPAKYHVVDILFAEPEDGSEEQVKRIAKAAGEMAMDLSGSDDINALIKATQQKFVGVVVSSEDLDWRTIDQLPEIFVKDISWMKVDQVVGPITAPNGLHLLKLLGFNKGSSGHIKLTREQATEIAYHNKMMKELKPWLAELRKAAYIKLVKPVLSP